MKMLMASALDIDEPEKGSSGSPQKRTISYYLDQGDLVALITSNKQKKPNTKNSILGRENFQLIRFELPLCILKLENYKIIGWFARLTNWLIRQLSFILLSINLDPSKFDLIYAYEVDAVPALWFISIIYKKPFITRFQGTIINPNGSVVNKIRNWQHILALRVQSDLTIMTNDGTQGDQVLKSLRKKYRGVEFLVNGISQDFFGIKQNNNILNNTALRLYCCGRLVGWKNHDRNIRILAKSIQKVPNIELIMIGDGPDRQALELLARELGVSTRIKFTGALEHKDLMCYIEKSDIYLSNYDLSNFGKTMMEAMAGGKTVLASDVGDTAHFLLDNQNGYIFKENDIQGAVDKIIYLSHNRRLLSKFGDQSRKIAQEKFWSWHARFEYERNKIISLIN